MIFLGGAEETMPLPTEASHGWTFEDEKWGGQYSSWPSRARKRRRNTPTSRARRQSLECVCDSPLEKENASVQHDGGDVAHSQVPDNEGSPRSGELELLLQWLLCLTMVRWWRLMHALELNELNKILLDWSWAGRETSSERRWRHGHGKRGNGHGHGQHSPKPRLDGSVSWPHGLPGSAAEPRRQYALPC